MHNLSSLLKGALGDVVAIKETERGCAVCLRGAYRLDGDAYTVYVSEEAGRFKLEDGGDYDIAYTEAQARGRNINSASLGALLSTFNASLEDNQIVMRCRREDLGSSVIGFTLLIFRLIDTLVGPENN